MQASADPMAEREATDPILAGGGVCGALMRVHDWSRSPLGPPAAWPQELRTVVGITLGSLQPMLIVWGPEQTTLYNDGYAAMCGERHPAALGRPFRELWFDIWDQVDPIITAAYAGIGTSMDDIEFLMHRKGYPEETHFAFSYTPVRDGQGRVLGMFCACQETTDTVLSNRARARERDRMLQVFERALGAVAILEGPDHVFTYVNPDYLTLVGNRDVVGKPIREALPEIEGQGFVELLDTVYTGGEAHVGRSIGIDLQRRAGAETEKRFVDFLYQPMRDVAGQVDSIFVQAIDVTERIEAERQQALVNRELGHRLKNQLAMVQAIVSQTIRSAPDLESAAHNIGARVQALAHAHDILIAEEHGRTTVEAVVRRITLVHDDPAESRFVFDGPEMGVASRPALSLSLILHELSTNAAKYGALSNREGIVNISWGRERNEVGDRFFLRWREIGGPPVLAPAGSGTGTRLIRAGLSGTIDCVVALDYDPEGVTCGIGAELLSFQTER